MSHGARWAKTLGSNAFTALGRDRERHIRKLLIGLGVVVVLLLVALAAWEPLTAGRVTPPPARKYDSIIARDRWGVPHVFGKTDPDVAYGVAYAHAEDDFATLQEIVAMTRGGGWGRWPASRARRPTMRWRCSARGRRRIAII